MSVLIPLRIALLAGVLALLGSALPARAEVVAHWTFDALDKGGYPDSSPKGEHAATPENKSLVVPFEGTAPFGKAITLNGKSGSYLSIPPLDFVNGSFTVSVWFNATVAARNPILADWNTPNFSYQFGLELTPDKAQGLWGELRSPEIKPEEVRSRKNRRLTSIVKIQTSGNAKINEWHHAAWVWNRVDLSHATMTVYLDGFQVDQQNLMGNSTTVWVNKTNARIGYREDQKTLYNGSIDELWVFNTALSEDQVKSLMKTNKVSGGAEIAKVPANTGNQIAVVTPQNPSPAVSPTPVAPSAVAPAPNPTNPNPDVPTPAPAVDVPDTEIPPAQPAVAAHPVDVSAGVAAPIAAVRPHGYSPTRLAGLATTSLVALVLASYLVWAFSERAKLGRH